MAKVNFFKRLMESLFVDKYNCILCDAELEEPNEYGICPTCMANLPVNDGGNICKKCGKHMKDEAEYCVTCQNNGFFFDINRSKFIYKDGAKKLIYNLKFGGKKYVAKYMASFYVDLYKKYDYDADVVVSVPISKGRRKSRGYNQAREIALVVAERLGLPYVEDAVVKVKDLIEQEKLTRQDRLVSVLGAFKLNKPDEVKGKRVLLIDDVLTTGATMSSVSMELKRKASYVMCLTFASPEVNYNVTPGNILDDYEGLLDRD